MTPHETNLFLRGCVKRYQREQQGRIWLAFNIAAFSRQKRLSTSDYNKMMYAAGVERRHYTPEEIRDGFKARWGYKKKANDG